MKKKLIIILLCSTLAIAGVFSFLSARVYLNAQEDFEQSGYILSSSGDPDSVNEQSYFDQGTKYQESYSGKITFKDINDNKVVVDSKTFVHYDDDSLFGLDDSVIMDTDKLDEEQISYYSVSSDSILRKSSNQYLTSNAGGEIKFSNFIWKISDSRYMIVSKEINLVVSEQSQQTFDNYIELEYIDAGVVHLVNKEGTYSTISSDAYLELANGIRIYIGSKNVSNKDGIIMNLTQMVVDSDDNIEIIPDEDYKRENIEQPQIIINANDGEEGALGEDGDDGKVGQVGQAGVDGRTAYQAAVANGEFSGTLEEFEALLNGADGEDGDDGDDGNPGLSYQEYIERQIAAGTIQEGSYEEWLKNNLDSRDGEDGDDGDDGLSFEDYIKEKYPDMTYEEWIAENLNGKPGVDGKDGKKGDEGNPGDPGTGGNQGAGGTSGTGGGDGDDGKSAKNSGIAYIEDVKPKFSIKKDTLDVSAFSVNCIFEYSNEYTQLDGTTGYIDMDTTSNSVEYLIIDNTNGDVIWRRTLNPNELRLAGDNYLCQTASEMVSILRQNTEYALAINATYRPVNYVGETPNDYVKQEVFRQIFTTDSYGLSMKLDHTTTDSIFMNIEIEQSALDIITKFSPDLYTGSKAMMQLTTDYNFEIVSENAPLFVLTGNVIDISAINPEEVSFPLMLQVKFTGAAEDYYKLDDDTLYYGKINVQGLKRAPIGTIPTSNFEYVPAKTHKELPVVTAPDLYVNETLTSLNVLPGYVEDPQNGIEKYRYDFYEVTSDGEGGYIYNKVNYSVTKSTRDSFSVNVFDDGDVLNNTKLQRGYTYAVKTIALFNNNEYIEEVESDYSKPCKISLDEIVPTSEFDFQRYGFYDAGLTEEQINKYKVIYNEQFLDKVAPSVIDGKVLISDKDDLISPYATITVTYTSLDLDKEVISGSWSVSANSARINPSNEDTLLSIPFVFENLREDSTYQISVTCNNVTINGEMKSNYPLGSEVVKTAKYSPIFFSGVDVNTANSEDAVRANLYFTLDPDKYVEQNAIKLKFSEYAKDQYKLGVEDTLDLSLKSLTAVYFDLYTATKQADGSYIPNESGKLNEARCVFYAPTVFEENEESGEYINVYKTWYKNLGLDDLYLIKSTITEGEGEEATEKDVYVGAAGTNDMNSSKKLSYIKDASNNITNVVLPKTYKGLDYTYSITLTEKSFANDDGLASRIASYKKDNPEGVLFIKATYGQDQTYARGIASFKPFKDANIIEIGNSEEFTGDIYDNWVEVKAARTVPEWKDDPTAYFVKSELTKKYYNDNKDFYEDINDCLSNIKELTDVQKANIVDKWNQNLADSTKVGYVIRGNSDWLSGYTKAVRYSVYDKYGELVTKSYYTYEGEDEPSVEYYVPGGESIDEGTILKEKYSEGGWIPCNMGDPLPEWVFYLDEIDSKSGKSVERGEDFSVVMDIALIDVPNEIEYKGEKYLLDYVYPLNYHDKQIKNTYNIAKQDPTLTAIQYKGTIGEGSDEYYAIIKDYDKAFFYDGSGNIVLHTDDLTEVPTTMTSLTEATGVPFLYSLKFDSSKPTFADYKLDDKSDTPTLIKSFVSEDHTRTGASITLLDADPVQFKEKTGKEITEEWGKLVAIGDDSPNRACVDVYFTVNTSGNAFKNAVKKATLKFTVLNPEVEPGPGEENPSIEIALSSGSFTIVDEKYDSESGTYSTLIKARDISYSELSRICNVYDTDGTTFDVSMSILYETNNYGFYYADVTKVGANQNFMFTPAYLGGGQYYVIKSSDPYPTDITTIIQDPKNLYLVKQIGEKEINKYEDVWELWYGYRSGPDEIIDGYPFSFNTYGANLIPKEVKNTESKINTELDHFKIGEVVPTSLFLYDKPSGMYSGTIGVQLTTKGTLITKIDDPNANLELELRDSYGTLINTIKLKFNGDADYTEDIDEYRVVYDASELKWVINYKNLLPSTEYSVDCYGYINRSETGATRTVLHTEDNRGKVETLNELNIDELVSKLIDVTASSTSRDAKDANSKVKFAGIYLSDIRKGVETFTINVYQVPAETAEEPEDLTPVTSITYTGDELLNALKKYKPSASEDAPDDFVLSSKLPFAPNAENLHILDGDGNEGSGTSYVAFVDTTYKNGAASVTVSKKIGTDRGFNETMTLNNPLRAAGIATSETEESLTKYYIDYTFSGTDQKRLLTGSSTDASVNSITYLVELHDVTSGDILSDIKLKDGTVIPSGFTVEKKTIYYPTYEVYSSQEVIDPSDKYEAEDGQTYIIKRDEDKKIVYEAHDVLLIDAPTYRSAGAGQGSYIKPIKLSFEVERRSDYYLKAYAIADIRNQDLIGVQEGDSSKAIYNNEDGKLVFDPVLNHEVRFLGESKIVDINKSLLDPEPHTVKIPYYVYVSQIINSPRTGNVDIQSINIIPEIKRIAVYGTALNCISKIEYQVTRKGDTTEDDFEFDMVTLTSENAFDGKWKESGTGQMYYDLSVGELEKTAEKSYSYYVIIKFYISERDTYELAATVEGSYSPDVGTSSSSN